MKRRNVITVLIITLLVMFICGQAVAEDLKRFKGQKLVVTGWSGLWTETFKEVVAKPFMKESGAIIIMAPGWSDFISKIKASPEDNPPFDVFVVDGWNYIAVTNMDRLLPLRKENIPVVKEIYPELLKREPWVKGYGVPIDGSFYVPAYNPKIIKDEPNSWSALLDPRVEGMITLDQAFYYGLYVAAFISDMKPGAQELYSEEGIDECFRVAKKLAKHTKKFYKGGAEFYNLVNTGEINMGAYYSGGIFTENKKGSEIAMIKPKEGVISWIGYFTVMKGTKNRDLSEALINYALDKDRMRKFSEATGNWVSNMHVTPPEGLKGINPERNEDFENITFFDWSFLNARWGELEERWKKEVLTGSE